MVIICQFLKLRSRTRTARLFPELITEVLVYDRVYARHGALDFSEISGGRKGRPSFFKKGWGLK